jgi:peroxidase
MASFCSSMIGFSLLVLVLIGNTNATLSKDYYYNSCPKLYETVKCTVESAIAKETRMGASLLRLFFHDCFVNVLISFLLLLLSQLLYLFC